MQCFLFLFALLLSVKVKTTILIFKPGSSSLSLPHCIILLFQPPPTLAAPPPQTAVPCGGFPPSVSLMQMFSLVTKPWGEFAAWLGRNSTRVCLCVATHPSTHFVFSCFPSKCNLSPPPTPSKLYEYWIMSSMVFYSFLLISPRWICHAPFIKHIVCFFQWFNAVFLGCERRITGSRSINEQCWTHSRHYSRWVFFQWNNMMLQLHRRQ